MAPSPQTGGCSVCGRTDVGKKKDGTLRHHSPAPSRGSSFLSERAYRCDGSSKPPVATQYGVRYKPDGPVFAYASREKAERERAEHGYGVLVFQDRVEGDPYSGRGWFEVPADAPEKG